LIALGRGWWVGWSRGPALFLLRSSSNGRPCSRSANLPFIGRPATLPAR